MKYSKRYIAFAVLLLFAFLVKLNTWNDEYAEVETFRGAALQDEVFYPLKARSINEEGTLSLVVGETSYGLRDGLLMGDHMKPMVSLSFAQELFGCSAKFYDEERVELHYNNDTYLFYINEPEVSVAGQTKALQVPPELHDGKAYLPLKNLCDFFSCEYSYDEENYQAVISSEIEKGTLPVAFDLRGNGRVTEVRDQGSNATCWAQASLTALESSLLPEEQRSFSVDHMVGNKAFAIDSKLGGKYTMAAAYLLSWEGPVENKKVEHHVQEIHFFDHDNREEIKWAIYQNGGVSTSIYANIATSNLSKSSYYNKKKNAYCYLGDEQPNHDVVIIGWNDRYSKDNFTEDVPGDGAFICQNSWGASFGEKGVFYVSYYDTNIGNQGVSYAKVEDADNYDSIYQSDLCGWVGQVGYRKDKIHGANVFTAKQDEMITGAGFYALDENTEYQVYFVPKYNGPSSLANRVEVASGMVESAGYYTIPFEKPYTVEEGQEFAVVLAISTPGAEYPMAIEYQSDELTKHVDISDGEGYISNNGLDWESVEEKAKGNLCIKAYGNKIKETN
ncbi:MAG: lectin like domain-containing protein [Lachnospiraceae bacterium]|nr:lectin like domain-containing protein [Lachnospiraceae bacterium]